MITVPLLHLLVKQDVYTTTNVIAPPHEMALLSVKMGSENVIMHEVRESTKDMDPNEEYQRLVRKYGKDPETKRTWAEVAFGQIHEGRLAETMRKGADHYKQPEEMSPQQKAANTRKANKAKLAEETPLEDAVPA